MLKRANRQFTGTLLVVLLSLFAGTVLVKVLKISARTPMSTAEAESLGGDEKKVVVADGPTNLNKKLTAAEAERLDLEARIQLISKRNSDGLVADASSTLIRTVEHELNQLEHQYSRLSRKSPRAQADSSTRVRLSSRPASSPQR